MVKVRNIKKSFSKIKMKFTHNITQEEAFEKYLTKILDEAIEEFEKNPTTISLEEWHEHMRREYNIVL